MEIVKNARVKKFPSASSTVKAALKKATDKAREQEWNKIIIIGWKNGQSGAYFTSSMSDNDVLGNLIKVQNAILNGD